MHASFVHACIFACVLLKTYMQAPSSTLSQHFSAQTKNIDERDYKQGNYFVTSLFNQLLSNWLTSTTSVGVFHLFGGGSGKKSMAMENSTVIASWSGVQSFIGSVHQPSEYQK